MREGDTPKEKEYRKYKNLIENYHSVIEPYLYKTKGFGSYRGGVAFFIVLQACYTYINPNERFGGKPPLPISETGNVFSAWSILLEKLQT
jgi:hypothetical protein